MDFNTLAAQRYSERKFDPARPVEREKIDYLLQAPPWRRRPKTTSPGAFTC